MSGDHNPPAFPRPHSGNTNFAQEGMTLRDYFAAKAIQGLLFDDDGDFSDPKWLAERAYVFADAMMKARAA